MLDDFWRKANAKVDRGLWLAYSSPAFGWKAGIAWAAKPQNEPLFRTLVKLALTNPARFIRNLEKPRRGHLSVKILKALTGRKRLTFQTAMKTWQSACLFPAALDHPRFALAFIKGALQVWHRCHPEIAANRKAEVRAKGSRQPSAHPEAGQTKCSSTNFSVRAPRSSTAAGRSTSTFGPGSKADSMASTSLR